MARKRNTSPRGVIIALLVLMNVSILNVAYTTDAKYYTTLLVTVPLLLISLYFLRPEKRDCR